MSVEPTGMEQVSLHFKLADPDDKQGYLLYGAGALVDRKHWGCRGSLVVIDARSKSHHAPILESDPAVSARIDALAAQGGPLARWL